MYCLFCDPSCLLSVVSLGSRHFTLKYALMVIEKSLSDTCITKTVWQNVLKRFIPDFFIKENPRLWMFLFNFKCIKVGLSVTKMQYKHTIWYSQKIV